MSRAIRPLATGVIVVCLTGGVTVALQAQEEANPYATPVDLRAGRQLFARHCSSCHGLDGTGGENGPDLTTGGFRQAGTDAGLFDVISEGIPNTQMVGVDPTTSDQSVWQLVAHVRGLARGARVDVAGNPSAGQELYHGKGDCGDCHVINGEGGRHGPDLSTIGSRRSPAELVSDLVEPDERVEPRWWRMRVTHRDRTRVEGLRMGEDTYSVRILDADDNLWSFLKRDLRESERVETSSMPSYAGELTDGELEDLVAYLYGLRRAGDTQGGVRQ